MPCYEFQCDDSECNHKFEKIYLHRISDEVLILDDPEAQDCPKCGEHASRLWSLTTMRPDRFWAGFYDDRLDKYWTSESRFNKHLKDNDLVFIGDRTDREGLTKMAEEGMKAKDRKAEKAVEKEIIDTLAWKDDWSTYKGSVKQQRRQEAEIRRLESENPNDVFEDSCFK